ncbi:ribonuclease P protein subunit p21-like [Salvelinus alpinus]|uniref:Ribonuclease P protein subunit p21-like n=1 Tax=Salvelinus namaycush TaxID=8040 RepID=A0A8U1ETY9_SALNM|nr:ribonuclease P protein subunit p21 [Salvelinus alpinus]XP_038858436.1 ribonuclease P protein subunit p21-like [Salvelinus namaycush]
MAANLKDKEAYQRLNFLYQAAHCVLSQTPENVELARFYCFTQKTIAKRLVLRQDPAVKRALCKKCCSLLVPGVTATARQRRIKYRNRMTVLQCLSCGQSKRFLNNPEHRLWVDQPEAQLENQSQPEQGHSTKELQKEKADGPVSQKSSTGPSSTQHQVSPSKPKT